MTTIRLLDARRGLYRKCEELFGNEKIAESIYRFLCDGIEECEDAEPERKKGKWIIHPEVKNVYGGTYIECSECGEKYVVQHMGDEKFCRNCGADMRGEEDE